MSHCSDYWEYASNTSSKKKKSIQTTTENSGFSDSQIKLFSNVRRKFFPDPKCLFLMFSSPFSHFPINQTPWGCLKRLTALSYTEWQNSKYMWFLSVSLCSTDINCWRTDNECVCIHKMYSITGETQIFILGTGICTCHMLFTITGINENMTAEKSWC